MIETKNKIFAWEGFTHIIIILLLAAAAIVSVVLISVRQVSVPYPSPTPEAIADDTIANWETYADSQATFKLPPGWAATQSPTEGDEYIVTITSPTPSESTIYPEIQLSINTAIDNNGNKLKLSSLSQAKEHYSQSFDMKSLEVKENYTIGKHVALSIEGYILSQGPSNGAYLQYQFIEFPGEILVAQLSDKNLQTLFDQILSTFEFTSYGFPEVIKYNGIFPATRNPRDIDIYKGYEFYYPSSCTRTNAAVINCPTESGAASIAIGLGGRGYNDEFETIKDNELNTYSFGEVKISEYKIVGSDKLIGSYSIGNTPEAQKDGIFSIEFSVSPIQDLEEVRNIMHQILSTFIFIK